MGASPVDPLWPKLVLVTKAHTSRRLRSHVRTAPLHTLLDNAARIAEMKNRGFTEAREQLQELRRHFFDREAEHFTPSHQL